ESVQVSDTLMVSRTDGEQERTAYDDEYLCRYRSPTSLYTGSCRAEDCMTGISDVSHPIDAGISKDNS
ncbi:hypothetical protein WKR88_29345, partial [Trinickia caryophylli]|uniref:hypothetical protein n=1 Tax=Trinickia caryophylli TaxID=28094 RepID=UPI0030BB1937